MQGLDVTTTTVLAGVLLANVGGLLSAYVSLKISLARLEVNVDNLEKDVNNLGGILRNQNKEL